MKLFSYILICLLTIVLWCPVALAETGSLSPEAAADTILRQMDMQPFEEYKRQIDSELPSGIKGMSSVEWIKAFMRGEIKTDPKEILNSLFDHLIGEVKASSHLLAKLLVLSVIAALLINLKSSFASESVAQIASLTCFLALAAIALGSFKAMLQLALGTVNTLADFMIASLPQMAVIMSGMGNMSQAALLFPLLTGLASAFADIIETVILPLITISAVLHLVNSMSETVKVENLAHLIKSLSLFVLGAVMTVFVGILTMRAVYASALSGLALRTTQLVTDNFPIVGGFLSDALGVASGYMALLKQAVGTLGVIIILGVCVFPVLKMLAMLLVYKLAAAMVEPMGDARTGKMLSVIGDHLSMLTGVVAAVGLMFIIMIAIIAGIANNVMLVP